jgi:hypothetical protein
MMWNHCPLRQRMSPETHHGYHGRADFDAEEEEEEEEKERKTRNSKG